MARSLPKFIVMKPCTSERYVYYECGTEHGHIFCSGESAFNAYSKIEVEPSKTSEKYCHLRFVQSNRYWSRCADGEWSQCANNEWGIAAVSKQPEEDTSKPSCTLFEPRIEEGGILNLTLVRNNLVVSLPNCGFLSLSESKDWMLSFNYIDWDDLVFIPKHVVFKGPNNKFLKGIERIGCHQYLQCSSIDGNDGASAQEAMLQPDGHVRIKSRFSGRFWRRAPPPHSLFDMDTADWIWPHSCDENGDDVNTLFWPVKVDDQTIALRSAGNNLFVRPITKEGKTDCAIADVSEMNGETRLVVEELVLERNIYNVKYRMEDARVFDEEPYVAGHAQVENNTDKASSLNLRVSTGLTTSSTFTHMTSLKLGAEATFKTGIPFIAGGEIKVSGEVAETLQWGSARTDKKSVEASVAVQVPPQSRVRANYVGTKGKCSIPFSYTQKDRSSIDGKCVTTYHIDGICNLVDYYSFRFEQFEAEPLGVPTSRKKILPDLTYYFLFFLLVPVLIISYYISS